MWAFTIFNGLLLSVSFRVSLILDFSRLPQIGNFFASYISIVNLLLIIKRLVTRFYAFIYWLKWFHQRIYSKNSKWTQGFHTITFPNTNAFTQKIVNGLKIFTTLLSLYSYSASILLLWCTDDSAVGKDSRKITGANKFGNDLF